jgi:hypothetical protein
MRLSKICLWGMAVATVATLLSPVVATVFPAVSDPARLFGSGLIVLAFFGVTMGAAAVIDNGHVPKLMWSGVAVGALAAALWITALWTATGNSFLVWQKLFTWLIAYACFVMITGVLLLVRAEVPWHRWLRRVTIVLVGLLGLQIALATSLHPGYGSGPVGDYEINAARLGAVIGLLAAGGVAGTLIGAWLCRVSGWAAPVLDYWIRCPRCGREQSLRTGASACAQCGLAVKLEVS